MTQEVAAAPEKSLVSTVQLLNNLDICLASKIVDQITPENKIIENYVSGPPISLSVNAIAAASAPFSSKEFVVSLRDTSNASSPRVFVPLHFGGGKAVRAL